MILKKSFKLVVLASSVAFAKGAVGATHIENYFVETSISSRFAKTTVLIDMVNDKDCATLKGFTFQLPINARVTELTMSLSDGCQMNSVVKSVSDAFQDFAAAAVEGKPAALLEAHDATNYAVTVSLPPLGNTQLKIKMEELLHRKRFEVPFQIPIFPGLAVNNLELNINIEEQTTGVAKFELDRAQSSIMNSMELSILNGVVHAHLELPNVPANGILQSGLKLPRLLSATYDAGSMPPQGLLLPNAVGDCIVHIFNPTDELWASTGSMPRNIVFTIDVSSSVRGDK